MTRQIITKPENIIQIPIKIPKSIKRGLRLYVWEEVNCDWTCGIAIALAENEGEAREMLINKNITLAPQIKGVPSI